VRSYYHANAAYALRYNEWDHTGVVAVVCFSRAIFGLPCVDFGSERIFAILGEVLTGLHSLPHFLLLGGHLFHGACLSLSHEEEPQSYLCEEDADTDFDFDSNAHQRREPLLFRTTQVHGIIELEP
jgi:hypothetical protein